MKTKRTPKLKNEEMWNRAWAKLQLIGSCVLKCDGLAVGLCLYFERSNLSKSCVISLPMGQPIGGPRTAIFGRKHEHRVISAKLFKAYKKAIPDTKLKETRTAISTFWPSFDALAREYERRFHNIELGEGEVHITKTERVQAGATAPVPGTPTKEPTE